MTEPLYDLTTTAQMYSQIAGVLVGFAFTSLLGYIRRAPTGSSAVTLVLFWTMAALIECAVLYGVLAGGQGASGNAYSGLVIIGPSFGLAIAAMFYATGLAARPFEHLSKVTASARVAVGLVIPAVVMFLTAAAILDVYTYSCDKKAPCDPWTQLGPESPTGLGLCLGLAVMILSTVGLWVNRRPTAHPPRRTPVLVSILVMGAVIASTVGYTILGLMPTTYSLTDDAQRWILIVAAILLLSVGWMATRSCHYVPTPPADPDPPTAPVKPSPPPLPPLPPRKPNPVPTGAVLVAAAVLVLLAARRGRKSRAAQE